MPQDSKDKQSEQAAKPQEPLQAMKSGKLSGTRYKSTIVVKGEGVEIQVPVSSAAKVASLISQMAKAALESGK